MSDRGMPYVERVTDDTVTFRWTRTHDSISMSWAELKRAAAGGVRGIAEHFQCLLTEAECLRQAARTLPPRRHSVRYGVRHES
jgi:hypothetical protein